MNHFLDLPAVIKELNAVPPDHQVFVGGMILLVLLFGVVLVGLSRRLKAEGSAECGRGKVESHHQFSLSKMPQPHATFETADSDAPSQSGRRKMEVNNLPTLAGTLDAVSQHLRLQKPEAAWNCPARPHHKSD